MNPIVNSAKAIILKNRNLLVVKKTSEKGSYYVLPGGRQIPGETLQQTLLRECEEELGIRIITKTLVFVREYIGQNHEFRECDGDIHVVELMFTCDIDSTDIKGGTLPDVGQIGWEWLPLDTLEKFPLYPSILKTLIKENGLDLFGRYLGDVN